jgi:hypothetical protein
MSNLKDGKKPLSQKPTPTMLEDGFDFGNKLYIEPSLKAEAKAKGLEIRFINAKKLMENSGYHENRWVPYLVEKGTNGTLSGFKFGNDPDGVLRRGDCILAARPIETGDAHRKTLHNRASRYSQEAQKNAEKNFGEAVRKAGLGKAIIGDENE